MTDELRYDSEPHGDVGAYLLGALSEGDAARFEGHLATCPLCAEELAELRPVTEVLSAGAPPVASPPELRARVMAEVRREAQLLQAAGAEADATPDRRRRIGVGRFSLRPVTAALAASAALAAGVIGFVAGDAATHRDGRGDLRAQTVRARLALDLPRGAQATLVRQGTDATLHLRGFPRPPRGDEYQVWLSRRDRQPPHPTPALFTVGRDGRASVDVPGRLEGVREILVTPERAGGSQSGIPSRSPIITATVG